MPNNASARRGKDKKNNDKKKTHNKKTDTPSLPKEDTASVDSGTLSLSSAGNVQARTDRFIVLNRMEEAIQKHAEGIVDADSELMIDNLRYEHSLATTVEERNDMRRKFRQEIRDANPLVSGAESRSLLLKAMIGAAIEWRGNVLQSERNSLSRKDKSSADSNTLTPSLAGSQDAPKSRSVEDQDMLSEHQRMLIRLEYSRALSIAERTEIRMLLREKHPGATQEEIRTLFAEHLMDKALEAHAKEKLFVDLTERIKEDELLLRGPAQNALLKEDASSLTMEESVNVYAEVKRANPEAGAQELGKILWAAKVQAALAWHKNRVQIGKTPSLSHFQE
jgi:hypothetical protein